MRIKKNYTTGGNNKIDTTSAICWPHRELAALHFCSPGIFPKKMIRNFYIEKNLANREKKYKKFLFRNKKSG